MAILKQTTIILNLYQTTKYEIDGTEKSVENLIIRYHFDSAKCFWQIVVTCIVSYLWSQSGFMCSNMSAIETEEGMKSGQIYQ